jgi:outer membrane lipoprotein SlyB
MISRHFAVVCSLSALAAISACSSNERRNERVLDPADRASNAVSYGRVSDIEMVPVSSRTSGGGAILGAVIGGVLGSQVGGGSGRDAATVVGAVGGAVVGNQVERRRKKDDEVYRVSVRLDNGREARFDYERIDDLRVGDRVKVQDGQLHRS